MVSKNRDIYGVLGTSWVLITYNKCPPVIRSFFLSLDASELCGGTSLPKQTTKTVHRGLGQARSREGKADVIGGGSLHSICRWCIPWQSLPSQRCSHAQQWHIKQQYQHDIISIKKNNNQQSILSQVNNISSTPNPTISHRLTQMSAISENTISWYVLRVTY